MPTDATYTPTWRELLRDLESDKLPEDAQRGLADSYGIDHTGLFTDELTDQLQRFIMIEVPTARWDEKAIWPLPPTPVVESTVALAWKQSRLILVALAIAGLALLVSFIALATDDNGLSKREIRQQARVELFQQLGIQMVGGNVNVLPDGLMATTAKREACKLTARQSANLRPDLGLDVAKVLAVCDTIK